MRLSNGMNMLLKKAKLIQEKIKLQELLKDTDKRVDNWLERAEEALIFAQHAKLAFENGSLQRKREILNALGSNLLLKNRKLRIKLRKLPLAYTENPLCVGQ